MAELHETPGAPSFTLRTCAEQREPAPCERGLLLETLAARHAAIVQPAEVRHG